MDYIGEGEIEYVFANPEGNKNIDVSNQPALTELIGPFICMPHSTNR